MKNRIACYFFLISISLCTQNAFGQISKDIQKEIDTQVWKPFKAAFEEQDGKALNDLYAEEGLRVTPAGIDTEGAFKIANLERFDGRKKEGTTIALDFWFDSRKTNETTSYEVGIFRITMVTSGIENVFYGQFHIVMKKINDSWKIT
jgi:ketosteroid isomerase-like protein